MTRLQDFAHGRTAAGLTAAAALLMLAGCQTASKSTVPTGQAGYDAIASGADMPRQTYRLYIGDQIAVRVYDEPEMSAPEMIVDNGGFINLPLIGSMQAAGLSAAELASNIEAALGSQYLRNPRVSVQVLKGRVPTIAVEGQVREPGVFPYEPGQSLLTALALSQSPTETARLDEVMIFRTAGEVPTAGRFDVKAIRDGRAPDVALLPGDKVVVGYSAARGLFNDFARIFPVVGIFRPY